MKSFNTISADGKHSFVGSAHIISVAEAVMLNNYSFADINFPLDFKALRRCSLDR